jgi:Fe-S-cluster containining protein
MSDYDCQTCGACCVHLGPYDGIAFVPLGRKEAGRMRRLGLRVVQVSPRSCCLAAAPHEGADGQPACVGFWGELGVRCGCSVYRDRPSACRKFEAGGDLCREARDRAGLPI